MKGIRRNGFVLIVVVVLVVSAAGELLVLVGLGGTMLFQTQAADLEAVQRNLLASGLAWARHNVRNQRREDFDKAIELDLTSMNSRRSTLTVNIRVPRDKGASVQINASCSRGKHTVRGSKDFHIKL